MMKDERITKIVVDIIKADHPGLWQFARKNSHTDDAGNRIFVREDGICWETCDWVDYDVIDRINDAVEAQGIEAVVEYSNGYEVMVEQLSH
jgi:hypothetical protein